MFALPVSENLNQLNLWHFCRLWYSRSLICRHRQKTL